jgi:hypothetical protein
VLDIVEAGEAVLRAAGFWLWFVSPKFRAKVASDWREAGLLGRGMIVLEALISVGLGLGVVYLIWRFMAA